MDRRLFLGSILGLALGSATASAQSQSGIAQFDPDPRLVHVKMIVVGYFSVVSEDRTLLANLDTNSFGVKASEFMASRFEDAGYPILVMDYSRDQRPDGVGEADVLHVRFRLDVSAVPLANDPAVLVGTVSTYFQRGEYGLLSWLPMTHFVFNGDPSDLTERAEQALLEQAQKGVVDQIVYLKKRGF